MPEPTSATGLRGEDHDRGLHHTRASVVSIEQPGWSVFRIGARLETLTDDPG